MLLGVSINIYANIALRHMFQKIITKNKRNVNNKVTIITHNQCR